MKDFIGRPTGKTVMKDALDNARRKPLTSHDVARKLFALPDRPIVFVGKIRDKVTPELAFFEAWHNERQAEIRVNVIDELKGV